MAKRRKGQYTVQNVGHPETSVKEEQWKDCSYHASIKAAFRAIDNATAHLEHGQWDDHYRIIDPEGNKVDMRHERDRMLYQC